MAHDPHPQLTTDEATDAVDRANEAIAFWRQREADAHDAIDSWEGWVGRVLGWFSDRERALAEAGAELEAARVGVRRARRELVEAQMALERARRQSTATARADEDRLTQLEQVAISVKERRHPGYERLQAYDDALDAATERRLRFQAVEASLGRLSIQMGPPRHTGMRIGTDAQFIALVTAHHDFHAACCAAEVEPPTLEAPTVKGLSRDEAARYLIRLDDQRTILGTIKLDLVRRLREIEAEVEVVQGERRALLERLVD